ncbi:hypothetical protein C8J57DRAFT_1213589 [Mycena rebaudengoi]|nr:hypothetical protein C8J57DRAFT_1213589 [Mycena rebaudengoi]
MSLSGCLEPHCRAGGRTLQRTSEFTSGVRAKEVDRPPWLEVPLPGNYISHGLAVPGSKVCLKSTCANKDDKIRMHRPHQTNPNKPQTWFQEMPIICLKPVAGACRAVFDLAWKCFDNIILDPREPDAECEDPATSAGLLKYPPALVLFRLDNKEEELPVFEELPDGLLPIVPSSNGFQIHDGAGKKHNIKRWQLALTGGYVFTDYKVQGQTMGYILIDLAPPPRGVLTPFNAYVALSRSRARKVGSSPSGIWVNMHTLIARELASPDTGWALMEHFWVKDFLHAI